MNGLQRNRKHVREIISLVKLFVVIKQMLKPDLSNLLLFAIHFSPSFMVYRNYETLFQRFFFLSQNKSFRQSFAIDTRKKRGAQVPVVLYILSQQKIFTFYHRGGYDAPVPLPNNMKKYILVYRQVPVGRE